MSTLSKVLVVLLVVLAIAHSAVLLAYLSQQRDWKALAQTLQDKLKNEQALRTSQSLTNQKTQDLLIKEKQDLARELAAANSQLTQADSKNADLNLKNGALTAENDAFRQELADLNASLQQAMKAQEYANSQLDRARDTANQLKAENTQLERQVSELTTSAANLNADIRSKKEQIAALQSEIRRASGRVSTAPAPIAGYGESGTPMAAKPIKGRVTAVNLAENLATINVGSIAGVSVGTKFIIFDNEYVGDLKITSVLRDQSIGTIIITAKPIKVGDEVATSLLE